MINHNRGKFDERQAQLKNRVGHQCFLALFFLLLLQLGLQGYDIPWLQYPLNVYITMNACMAYYLIRTWLLGASVADTGSRHTSRTVRLIVAAVALVCLTVMLFFRANIPFLAGLDDASHVIITCAAVLVLVFILAAGSRAFNNQGSGD